uniref:ImmA/IrrE family metallo-endopeptidase n=1 Tax=Petrachloros mirabilis TaxID=2918835 RepID=UPI001EE8AD23
MAYDLYKRPLALFFLPEPPQEADVKQEFRTLPNAEIEQLLPNTRYLLRLGQAFQLSLKELTEGMNPSNHKIFKEIKLTDAAQIPSVAQRVREYLAIDIDTQVAWGSTDEALKAWRNAVESAGVFVFKQSFKQKTISGFCLIDAEFPIIFISNGTTKTRQIFTLFHELAHLFVGVNSISKVDDSYIDELPSKEQKIEQLCNALAAAILVPPEDFLEQIEKLRVLDDDSIQALANRYRVSREVILRLSLDSGNISQGEYSTRVSQGTSDNGLPSKASSGGSYYATQATYLGESYLKLVFGKYYQGKIDVDQVAEHLGVKAKNVAALEAQFTGRGSAA